MDFLASKVSEETMDPAKPKEQQPERVSSDEHAPAEHAPTKSTGIDVEIPQAPPDPSRRRKSATVSNDHAGCYLAYDQAQAKWVATWNSEYMLEAVAILTPHVKVPQFKYAKRERVVLEGEKRASRDVKLDYLLGICSFFKLIRDFKGDLTLLPSAEDLELKELLLVGLHGNEIIRFDKFDFTYPYLDLDCIALVRKTSLAFSSKHMEQAIFMGKASREGFALSLKARP